MSGSTFYIAPAPGVPLPDLAGTALAFYPTIYDARSNVLTDRIRPRLRFVGDDKPVGIYDPAACDEMAAYLLAGGVSKVCLDWEQPDNPSMDQALREANRMAYLQTAWRLIDRGLTLSWWGCDPEGQWNRLYCGVNNSGEVHPIFYQYTRDYAAWEADRTRRLAQVRKAYPDARIVGWLNPFFETIDGAQLPAPEPVPPDMLAKQMAWCRLHKIDGVVWEGAELPAALWAVLKAKAAA